MYVTLAHNHVDVDDGRLRRWHLSGERAGGQADGQLAVPSNPASGGQALVEARLSPARPGEPNRAVFMRA